MDIFTEKFLENIVIGEEDECWPWFGTTDTKGYGRFRIGKRGKVIISHRYSYEHFIGPIPDSLVIDHMCNNTGCQNPSHMEPKSIYENAKRGFTEERKLWERGTCRSNLHTILSDADVYKTKSGVTCRKCKNTRDYAGWKKRNGKK